MSQSQKPQTQVGESGGMNRRAFLRRGAAGAVAVGGFAYARPPVQNAQAFPPALAAAGGIAVGAAAGYTTRHIQDYLTADDFDEEAYEDANDEELYNGARPRLRQIEETNETVLTTIENNISSGQNAAFSEAKKDAIEQLNLENGEDAALDAAKEANDEYWSIAQENLARHVSGQMAVMEDVDSAFEANDMVGILVSDGDDDDFNNWDRDDFIERTMDFLNGSSYLMFTVWSSSTTTHGSYGFRFDRVTTDMHSFELVGKFDETSFVFMDGQRFVSLWNDIEDNHAEVESEIETWVSGVADGYEAGDVSLSDAISPSDIANNAADSDGFAYAGADLASLGLSTIGGNWDIRLEESDTVVRGTIYLLTDETLTTGQTYSPGSISGPVYLSYEWEDAQFDDEPAGSDLVALEQDFTILGGTAGEWVDGEDGERVYETQTIEEGEEISFTETYQSTTDTDIEAFREELRTLRERNQELEEIQLEAAGGGGGLDLSGLSIGGLSGELVALIAAAIVAIFAFKDDDKKH